MGIAMPGVIDDYSGSDGDLFEMYEPADPQEAAEVTAPGGRAGLKKRHPRAILSIFRCTRNNVAHLDRSAIAGYPKQIQDGSYHHRQHGGLR